MLSNCGVGENSWDSKEIKPVNPKGNQSWILTGRNADAEYSGVLNIHWCWSWSSNILTTWCKELTLWKKPWFWERLKAGGEGDNRWQDGWRHHWLGGHEFKQALGVGYGLGSLVCCSPWGHKELDMSGQLNWLRALLGCLFLCTYWRALCSPSIPTNTCGLGKSSLV